MIRRWQYPPSAIQAGRGLLLLPLVEPADQHCQEPAEGRCVEHGGTVYTTAISGP